MNFFASFILGDFGCERVCIGGAQQTYLLIKPKQKMLSTAFFFQFSARHEHIAVLFVNILQTVIGQHLKRVCGIRP